MTIPIAKKSLTKHSVQSKQKKMLGDIYSFGFPPASYRLCTFSHYVYTWLVSIRWQPAFYKRSVESPRFTVRLPAEKGRVALIYLLPRTGTCHIVLNEIPCSSHYCHMFTVEVTIFRVWQVAANTFSIFRVSREHCIFFFQGTMTTIFLFSDIFSACLGALKKASSSTLFFSIDQTVKIWCIF